jgi:hypothetical protein
MLRRVESDESAAALSLPAGASRSEAIVPVIADSELETGLLPRDHPRWVRDAIAVSQRAREIIAKLKPVVIRALSFWDHRLRSIVVGGRRVDVDPSGCYRVE